MVAGALAGPRRMPFTPFCSCSFAASKGRGPKGRTSPTRACLPSGVTYNTVLCWPCSLARITVTSARPCAAEGLIALIFQLIDESYPNICYRNELNVIFEGRSADDYVYSWVLAYDYVC